MTLEELKALYAEKGATQRREEQTEQGIQYYDDPVQLGEGWTAWEKQPTEIIDYIGQGMDATPIYKQLAPEEKLGGFTKQEGDYVTTYDLNGNPIARHKWNESDLKTIWRDLGPMIMTAATMGGGAGLLGNSLFGLTGSAASAAGGALLGGANAAFTDQDILKGALLGGAASAGGMELGDTGIKVADAAKAYNFAQNPTLAGAASLASPYVGSTQIGDSGISLTDILKGAGTAQALASGDERQIFNALTGMAKDQDKSLKMGIGPDENFSEDLIEGYFQPGGAGYEALMAGDTTVLEEPQNLDALLRSLSPYAEDGGTSVFKQPDDVPEFTTTDKRPITSIESILGNPDILQTVEADLPEVTITGDRPTNERPSIYTKEIKSDIPDAITADQIDKLFPDLNPEDILQLVTSGGTKTTTPTKTTTKTPGTTTTEQALANLGLNAPMPSQDPYANIKLMEELFGGDTAYKLRALGAPKNLASADLDALARLLRG